MAERIVSDRRRELLDAAVLVFARKGFRAARVGDIAEEAGVAHGLLYHYFRSKDEVLETIFRDTWQLLESECGRIEAAGVPLREQLRRFARIYLGSWLMTPELIGVLVREIARSPQLQERIGDFQPGFDALTRVIERGQQTGEIDPALDARVATFAVWGMIDEVLTAWVLGRLPAEEQNVDAAEATVTALVRRALATP